MGCVGMAYRYRVRLVPHGYREHRGDEGSVEVKTCLEAGWELVKWRLTSEGDTVAVFRLQVPASEPSESSEVPAQLGGNPVQLRWLAARAEWMTLGVSQTDTVDDLVP